MLGVLKVHTKRYDFKDLEIPTGAYVMRFAIQPENGDHLGVAPTRTFALLVPAQEDREVEALMQHDAVVKASSKINQGEHPSVLNLQRVKQPDGRFPGLAVHEDGKFKVLNFRLAGRLKDHEAPIPLAVALVSTRAALTARQRTPARGTAAVEWRTYGADLASTRYSPLDQIDNANFSKLKIAWRLLNELITTRKTGNRAITV